MKKVFICSPLRGDYEKNIENAKRYCRVVADAGAVPIAPHVYFTQFLDDTIETERNKGIAFGLDLLMACDEIWVFGETISEGMKKEIARASLMGIPVKYKGAMEINSFFEDIFNQFNRMFMK